MTTIILAAGAGTRMKSRRAKVNHEVSGKTLLNWVLKAADEAGSSQNIVVIGHQAAEVKALLPETVETALQAEQKGTGHAVQMALNTDVLFDDTLLVLCGDTPLLRAETLQQALQKHQAEQNAVTVLTAKLDDPTGYGRILRNETGSVTGIKEHRDATAEQRAVREVNTGVFLFQTDRLKELLPLLKNNNQQGEYYLTDVVGLALEKNNPVGTYLVADATETLGINDRRQLAAADALLQKRIRERWMIAGVTFVLPETSWIADDVTIGADTSILPGVFLEKGTSIGENCQIGPNTRITSSVIDNDVTVMNSVLTEAMVGEASKVGPFAYLRPGSCIGKHVKIGDFVEIKKSVIGDDTKISHLTYVGDAEVGQRVNLGCGVVVVNYDGRNKNRTVIGNDVFVGCNTNLVSPVEIKEHAYIAAGSTITEEVPAFALGIARSRQTVLEDWVRRKGLDKPKKS